jgi:hypothetical protein
LRQVEASVNAQIEAQLKLVEHRNIPIKKKHWTKVQWPCLEKIREISSNDRIWRKQRTLWWNSLKKYS